MLIDDVAAGCRGLKVGTPEYDDIFLQVLSVGRSVSVSMRSDGEVRFTVTRKIVSRAVITER